MPRLTTSTKLKIGYAALAGLDTWLAGQPSRHAHRARFLTKPLLMPTLAASLATNERAESSPLRSSTLMGLAGGWGGDVMLLGQGTKPFIAGAGSFGLGHAAYLTGFVRNRGRTPVTQAAAPRAVAGAWAASAPVMGLLAARRQRELGAPVFGYATFLAAMVVGASHLDDSLPASARRLTAAGAGLFMLSDTLLGIRKFALTEPPAALETSVMATYTTAQFLIAEGAARA